MCQRIIDGADGLRIRWSDLSVIPVAAYDNFPLITFILSVQFSCALPYKKKLIKKMPRCFWFSLSLKSKNVILLYNETFRHTLTNIAHTNYSHTVHGLANKHSLFQHMALQYRPNYDNMSPSNKYEYLPISSNMRIKNGITRIYI